MRWPSGPTCGDRLDEQVCWRWNLCASRRIGTTGIGTSWRKRAFVSACDDSSIASSEHAIDQSNYQIVQVLDYQIPTSVTRFRLSSEAGRQAELEDPVSIR